MNHPDWLSLVLLTLAAFRAWRVIGIDVIADRPRDWLVKANTPEYKESLDDFLACPWCAGFWISGIVLAVWCLVAGWIGLVGFVVSWLAISAGVGLIRTAWDH